MEVRGGEGGKEDFSVSVGFIWKTDRQAGQKKSNIVAALAMWDTKICANDVRRMNNGVFNGMMDEEEQ
ncbi:hypothetical protein T07_13910 [Trichinella nelsoni]|uniref:Uncharacterized protein n=1 Tax=Trichinella nelsoni TaxID=6336 RepID=A0A0V0RV57_9BILA|nr:hypothetical protein T07_13910 [Trichinella nelsoni]